MNMYEIIEKKKCGHALTDEEIGYFVDGYTCGAIPDYQASALCMAICFSGMDENEAASLTAHMMNSGDTVDLSSISHTADKHSTGGVGDKTTLIAAPTAASLGCSVAKMTGRGLGHTGGTLDKLESIPGYNAALSNEEFMAQVKRIGIAVIGQTGNLAPADKKLYALRDVTATVDSIPLIASSIMSKKLAAGAGSIVLDVKYGSGAFMKTPEDALILAETMVRIGKIHGRNMRALITDMSRPLGKSIGNSLEVIEAVGVLRGEIRGELYEICSVLAANMAHLALDIPYDEALDKARYAIDSGAAYDKFLEWISAQGGDISYIEQNKLTIGEYSHAVKAPSSGVITVMNTEGIGLSACHLGAGRQKKDDIPDLSAGIVMNKTLGNTLSAGDTICTLYTSDKSKLQAAEKEILSAVTISPASDDCKYSPEPLIYKII